MSTIVVSKDTIGRARAITPKDTIGRARAITPKDTIGRARAITPKATTDPDQKTARPIGRRRWPKFCRGSHRLACAQSG